ncbi:MAG: CsbD family protein [Actinomycetota bacterium]
MSDKAQNKAQEVKGSAQEKVGRATGDREMEAEGRSEQSKSNMKQAGEKLKDAVKSVTRRR